METDILIVGAGLSGLALARALTAQGRDFQIVDARDRIGGRILSIDVNGAKFDMGPAWFWPGQPRIADMIDTLGLTKFDQFADGILTHEDERGAVQRGRGYASMQGSWRLAGGLGALTHAIADKLAQDRLHLETRVTGLQNGSDAITATLDDGTSIRASKVVLALPLRIVSELTFDPQLPSTTQDFIANVPTWMAGHAKAVAVYDTPFWRDEGLSGDAMSRRGPMVEIHDASPANGGPYALFGFMGVPPKARQDVDGLRAAVTAQLANLFGPKAATPIALHIKDWAFDPNTATGADQAPLYAHPQYGLRDDMRGFWNNRLILSGTETANEFGGFLEGALEAAENALEMLRDD